ncbi:MAG: acetyltransferase [Desulfobulbaceae bacterium]|nr:acetyltransferase [Desulfobulbaceae bacterium]MCK5340815.1 acetyltransferase [Desulfobulbaceae bacterium]
MYYDIFNGDADGICALHQLRMAEPRESQLISGVKRDNRLVMQVEGVRDAKITVLDISLDINREALLKVLDSCEVLYIDHHYAGDIPDTHALTAHIDPSPDTCTSLIVDRLLEGRFRAWAVAAAFGDNLHDAARKAAASLPYDDAEIEELRELGELLNYNGYGKTLADLHFSPTELFTAVQSFADPLEFCRSSTVLSRLRSGFRDDMARAGESEAVPVGNAGRVYRFPGEPWARRVAGVFSNEKAREIPEMAHVLMVDNNNGTFMVSVRAPLADRRQADELCRAFPTGGGRAAAAGINELPAEQEKDFLRTFMETYSK